MEHRVVSQLPCERCAALQAENARLRDLIALINREKDRCGVMQGKFRA